MAQDGAVQRDGKSDLDGGTSSTNAEKISPENEQIDQRNS